MDTCQKLNTVYLTVTQAKLNISHGYSFIAINMGTAVYFVLLHCFLLLLVALQQCVLIHG